jgi:hypothetical protein
MTAHSKATTGPGLPDLAGGQLSNPSTNPTGQSAISANSRFCFCLLFAMYKCNTLLFYLLELGLCMLSARLGELLQFQNYAVVNTDDFLFLVGKTEQDYLVR